MSSTSESSEATSATARHEAILVGFVVGSHGLRGEVVVEVLSDVESRFAPGAVLHLVPRVGGPAARSRAAVPRETVARSVRIATTRPHKGTLLVRFDGIEDRTAADGLRGARLEVDASAVPAAPEGSYYHFQLVGCDCHDRRHGLLGQVQDVIEDGGGEMLVVGGAGGNLPIPFVHAFVTDVDLAARRIDVDLPEGLVETCTSRS